MPNIPESLPQKLTYLTAGVNGKWRYIVATLKYIIKKPHLDLIVCGHIKLLPLAILVKYIIRRPILVLIYGIDVWQPTNSLLTNNLIRRVKLFVSISNVTKQRFLRWAKVDAEKVIILPNAIDLCRFKPGKKSLTLLDSSGLKGKTVIMTFGRLVSKERCKGFDEILEMSSEMINDDPNIFYLFARRRR